MRKKRTRASILAGEITKKKTVHVEMTKTTHTRLRVKLLQNGELSIQSVFEEVAQRIGLEDPYMMRLLAKVKTEKRNKVVKQLEESEVEDLFSLLEAQSPLKD